MKAHNIILAVVLLLSITSTAQQSNKPWVNNNLFKQDVFIENKGQCNHLITHELKQPILYYAQKGNTKLLFSSNGITFEQNTIIKNENGEVNDGDDDQQFKIVPQYISLRWEGSSPDVHIEVTKPVSNYYTYSNPDTRAGMPSMMVAHAWQKLIYYNLYKNIDFEFYFPDKGGIEYDIIVHPGADISLIKMKYNGAQLNIANGNVQLLSPLGDFIDHSPVAKDEAGNIISSAFALNGNTISFTTDSYDKTKTLIIDPWMNSTGFTGTNKAYDVQYDMQGNAYVMGGGDNAEYQLEKYSGGILQWTHSLSFTYNYIGKYYYGAFTVDKRSGSIYIAEGLDYGGTGCLVTKLNTSGTQAATFLGNSNVNEIWRMAFDYCNNDIILGAGQGSSSVYQAAILDTNCTSITPVNILGVSAGVTHHDITMMALDGFGKCYFATSEAASASYPGYNNVLLQVPAATLSPTAYQVYDHSAFTELASISYYPTLPSAPYLYSGNGYNGIAADAYILVTYDGNKIRKWNPATGAIIDSITVSPNQQLSGGITLDCNENIYVGNNNSVVIYDSALNLKNTFTLTDTIYDIKITNTGILYACGKGFVSTSAIPSGSCSDSACGTLTGISGVMQEGEIVKLSPNPNNGIFTLRFTNKELSENNKLCFLNIYNVIGENIFGKGVSKSQLTINLNNQPSGVYFYRLTNIEGLAISSGKVVIQK